jgi:cysteine desulfurase/selenocysteine lyase
MPKNHVETRACSQWLRPPARSFKGDRNVMNSPMPSHPEFPLDDAIVHLNHAGVAPWPRRTVRAVEQFAMENMTRGSQNYKQWLQVENSLRHRLRWLINAETTQTIALLKNTSEALSVVAYGIAWKTGNNVVTSLQEFPSNRIVWESLMPRFGIDVRLADLNTAACPEEALLEQVDSNTQLVSVSSVQYGSGVRMDLAKIGRHCHAHDILFCVDAIQSLGAVPFDAQQIHADFVVADGHKWMLSPEGVALLYCAPHRLTELRLSQFGWHMVERPDDFDSLSWRPAPDARRFECGSPNSLGIHALDASLGLIQEIGIQKVFQAVTQNVSYLMDKIKKLGFECLTPSHPERRAGIFTFRLPGKDNRPLYEQLSNRGVLCAYRAGGIRFSPHFYTSRQALDRALKVVEQAKY